MKNIPKILVKTYLRRQPIHLRLSRFNFLTRYSWLKNLLEDLKPEFFPEPEADTSEDVAIAAVKAELAARPPIPKKLEGKRGKQGLYTVGDWLGKRGNGHLFQGVQADSKRSVVIKEYLLPVSDFTSEELRHRQQAFKNLAGFQAPDDRVRDIRVIRPMEAIVDAGGVAEGIEGTSGFKRCYLITDHRDRAPSLSTILKKGNFSPALVRVTLAQILQTLSVLHQQKVRFPSGRIQSGLAHGNLRLENVLWVEEKGHFFPYLSDFPLWEQLFDKSSNIASSGRFGAAPEQAIADDLQAAGHIGRSLLTEKSEKESTRAQDPWLDSFIHSLSKDNDSAFSSAEAAWQALLALPKPEPADSEISQRLKVAPTKKRTVSRALITALGIIVLALLGKLFLFHREQGQAEEMAYTSACCLKEVSGLPAGKFTYAVIEGGIWEYVMQHQHLGERGRSLEFSLESALESKLDFKTKPETEPGSKTDTKSGSKTDIDPKPDPGTTRPNVPTTLTPALYKTPDDNGADSSHQGSEVESDSSRETLLSSSEEAMEEVRKGKADFSVLQVSSLETISPDLSAEVIAYDGLAAVVSFSYAERNKSLPKALSGKISLSTLRRIYSDASDTIDNWKQVEGPSFSLPLGSLYLSDNSEVKTVFKDQAFLTEAPENQLSDIESLPTLDMLRKIIIAFESPTQLGSIGIAPLSQIVGQCSVYPLAISTEQGQGAVQPWQLETGGAITPNTDLCDRKGLIRPDISAFASGKYPLAYPIVVVYPKDNSRKPIGQKFAELMKTTEGQKLLAEAGLVPLKNIADEVNGE